MGLISRILGAVARPVGRAVGIQAFEAGQSQRRLRAVPRSLPEINTQIRRYGSTVVARSRYLAQNNAYASSARAAFVSALVGCGIKPASLVDDAELKDAIRLLWNDWTAEADADGLTDFYGLQALVAAEMYEAGEVFIRLRPRRVEDGLTVPLQIQIIPSELLPLFRNDTLPDGAGRIESGIQFGPIGNRTAYWFLTRHPGTDQINPPVDARLYNIIPADQILHLFRATQAGQIRGIPHTLAALVPSVIMDAYDDAELEGKRMAALPAAFVVRPAIVDDEHPLEGGAPNAPPSGTGVSPTGDFGLEPGAIIDLEPGEEISFAGPKDLGASYEPFQYRQLTRICAALGVPYAAVTGDLRGTSYSSVRAGLVEFRRRIEMMQDQVMVFQLCRPIWAAWFDAAVLSGALPIAAADYAKRRREFIRARWQPPAWEWIDPLKDLQAEQLAVANGFKARSDVIEAQGYDPEEIDLRIAADQARAKDLGIEFQVGRSGESKVGFGGTPSDISAPEGTPGTNGSASEPGTPGPPAKDAAASVSVNFPTPWPHGETVQVLKHDALGRVLEFVKRPAPPPGE